MQKQTDDSGIYIIEIVPKRTFSFSHNKLGNYKFSKGYYYYVGSAQKNLIKRVERHIKKDKKLHWHIDYLTVNKNISIPNVYLIKNYTKENECGLVFNLSQNYKMEHPIKSFGSSDCNKCYSHLLYRKDQLTYSHLCSLYQSAVIFIPSSRDIF